MNLNFPLQFDNQGQTASTDDEAHIRNLIEQVLFTNPGERVNRPDFGSGLLQTVFEPNVGQMAATAQFLVQGALNRWLGNLIQVEEVQIAAEDARLEVRVAYTLLRNQERRETRFNR